MQPQLIEADIERTYGGAKKPLAARVPLDWSEAVGGSEIVGSPTHHAPNLFELPSEAIQPDAGTPGITEGVLGQVQVIITAADLQAKQKQSPNCRICLSKQAINRRSANPAPTRLSAPSPHHRMRLLLCLKAPLDRRESEPRRSPCMISTIDSSASLSSFYRVWTFSGGYSPALLTVEDDPADNISERRITPWSSLYYTP